MLHRPKGEPNGRQKDAECLAISNKTTRVKCTSAANLKYNLQFRIFIYVPDLVIHGFNAASSRSSYSEQR
jgi:hypothetical protein